LLIESKLNGEAGMATQEPEDKKIPFPEVDLNFLKAIFANWNPFPDRAYCEKVGWPVNPDGTVETPGLGRVPTRELCEVKELEQMYEVADLEELYARESNETHEEFGG
jgi:hypothetical protein